MEPWSTTPPVDRSLSHKLIMQIANLWFVACVCFGQTFCPCMPVSARRSRCNTHASAVLYLCQLSECHSLFLYVSVSSRLQACMHLNYCPSLHVFLSLTLSVSVWVRPAGPTDRPDQDFRLSGGGEAAAALRPLRVSPPSRRHWGWVRQSPWEAHREIHPQDKEVRVVCVLCVDSVGVHTCFGHI